MDKLKFVFKTTRVGNKTFCGVNSSFHRFANERNKHGHYPGIVYLAYLPNGEYRGLYKIGKAEHTEIEIDDFDLEKIHNQILYYLYTRFKRYHPGRGKFDTKYDGAKYIHGIRVACGEGAEKQPQSFFAGQGKLVKHEIFRLTQKDIEIFRTSKGDLLGYPIKHIFPGDFAKYLMNIAKLPKETVREWIELPQ
jgi:hypothetical protein